MLQLVPSVKQMAVVEGHSLCIDLRYPVAGKYLNDATNIHAAGSMLGEHQGKSCQMPGVFGRVFPPGLVHDR